MQPEPLRSGEGRDQAVRDDENDTAVIGLPSDDARLTGLDAVLDVATIKEALPLDHSLLGIEVAARKRFEDTSRPGPQRESGGRVIRRDEELNDDAHPCMMPGEEW